MRTRHMETLKKKTLIPGCPCHPLIPCEKARQSCCSDQSGSKSYSTFPASTGRYCSFVALAAGGAVRLYSRLLFSYITRLSPIPASFVLSPPSLNSVRQRRASAASSASPWTRCFNNSISALNQPTQKEASWYKTGGLQKKRAGYFPTFIVLLKYFQLFQKKVLKEVARLKSNTWMWTRTWARKIKKWLNQFSFLRAWFNSVMSTTGSFVWMVLIGFPVRPHSQRLSYDFSG